MITVENQVEDSNGRLPYVVVAAAAGALIAKFAPEVIDWAFEKLEASATLGVGY